MSPASVPDEAVARLGLLLLERVGLKSTPDGQNGLRLAILARLQSLQQTDGLQYVRRLEVDTGGDELRLILPLVTVGKTDFFRDPHQFRALRQRILPTEIHKARVEGRRLRVWSAGCATGEEPYSLAMLAMELGILPSELELVATDVNPPALLQAQRGLFPQRRLSGLTPDQTRRFFIEREKEFEVSPAVKEYVRFQQHNLAADDFPVPADRGPWDLILCRNVIIYFDGATISRIVGRFYELLRDGSFLCLGYSESLYRIFNDFVLAEVEGAFLYSKPLQRRPPSLPKARAEDVIAKLREDVERRKASAVPRPSPGPQPQPYKPNQLRTPLPGSVQALNGGDWRSSPSTSVPPTPLAPRLSVSADPLVAVARLVDGGEFLTAFTTLTEALNRSPGNLALQITLGNLCTVMGRTAEARAAYLAALAVEPLCAEAHLCLGIASSEAGAPFDAEALQELTRAIFLDPHVPLAHYYYGRLCERRGDHASARRAYRNAINACRDQRGKTPFLGFYPDLPADPAVLARAAQYALAALEEA